MMRLPTPACLLACLIAVGTVPCRAEDEALTQKELAKFEELYRAIRRDDSVRKARRDHENALQKYHDSLREAMLRKDPSAEPLLRNIRFSLAALVDSMWKRRDREILKTLHYPIDKLDDSEKERWNAAVTKMREQPFVQHFQKEIAEQHKRQEDLRREHAQRSQAFKMAARQTMEEIDPELKPVFEKLDHIAANRRAERAAMLKSLRDENRDLQLRDEPPNNSPSQEGNSPDGTPIPSKGSEQKSNQPTG